MTDIGSAYGGALFQLAREAGRDGDILEQMDSVCRALREEPDFTRLMSSPNLKKSQRLEILSQSFEGKLDVYLMNFMSILVENSTFEELPACLEAYRELYNEAHGVIAVRAVTAVPLSPAQSGALVDKLSAATGKTVQLTNSVDPSCIAGVRLEMDGKRLDGSVRARLDSLRESLLNISPII